MRAWAGGVLAVLALAGCGPDAAQVVAGPSSGASSTATWGAGAAERPLASTTASPAPTASEPPKPVKKSQPDSPSATYPAGWPKRSGSTALNSFTLVGTQVLDTGMGYPQVDMVDQDGCGTYSTFMIWAYYKIFPGDARGPSWVRGTYHVTAAKPVPDGSFEMSWDGGYQGSDDMWRSSGGPVPAVAGNEGGGTVTFTIRARYDDIATGTGKTYTTRYTWKLDSCPGHPAPKVSGRLPAA